MYLYVFVGTTGERPLSSLIYISSTHNIFSLYIESGVRMKLRKNIITFCICCVVVVTFLMQLNAAAESHQQLESQPITVTSQMPRRHLREGSRKPTGPRPPKTLVGIFSTLADPVKPFHRQLFSSSPAACSLGEFQTKFSQDQRRDCDVIYTFVIGGNPNGPTEIVTSNSKLLVKQNTLGSNAKDIQSNDCTLLNIKENEDEGKSQTFLYFASRVMAEYKIDYVMKVDSKTALDVEAFFSFADNTLPPFPYNTNIIAGALRDKYFWTKPRASSDMNRLEGFWGTEHDGNHLYYDGQLYLLSFDVTKFVVEEALFAKTRIGFGGYIEGSEAHDIPSMAWHSPKPIHVIALTKSQRFWTWPIESYDEWNQYLAAKSL